MCVMMATTIMAQTATPDSVEVQELNEIVVEAQLQYTSATTSTYIPTSKQKNSSQTGTDLLNRMAIPQLSPSSDNALQTVSGKPVDIFIDFLPASEQDLTGMRMSDVRKENTSGSVYFSPADFQQTDFVSEANHRENYVTYNGCWNFMKENQCRQRSHTTIRSRKCHIEIRQFTQIPSPQISKQTQKKKSQPMTIHQLRFQKLPWKDSNPHRRNQNPTCYHYTTRQFLKVISGGSHAA
mgnify:CR=1 FL=1